MKSRWNFSGGESHVKTCSGPCSAVWDEGQLCEGNSPAWNHRLYRRRSSASAMDCVLYWKVLLLLPMDTLQ